MTNKSPNFSLNLLRSFTLRLKTLPESGRH